MSYVFNLTLGDDGSPKVIISYGGFADEGSPAVRLASAVLDALMVATEELEKEGFDIPFTVFDTSKPAASKAQGKRRPGRPKKGA